MKRRNTFPMLICGGAFMAGYEETIAGLEEAAEGAKDRRLGQSARRAAQIVKALADRGHDPSDVGEFLTRLADAPGNARSVEKAVVDLAAHLEKNHGIVAKGHYRAQWMSIGIAIGLPLGVAFGAALGSMAYLGLGLPLGLAVGLPHGSRKDDEAAEKGLQLDIPDGE